MLDNTWCKKEKIQSEIQIGNQYFSEISISLALYKLTVVPFQIAEALWAHTFCSSFPSLLDNARLLKLRILGVKVWKKVENTELSNFILKKQVGVYVPNPQPQQQPQLKRITK